MTDEEKFTLQLQRWEDDDLMSGFEEISVNDKREQDVRIGEESGRIAVQLQLTRTQLDRFMQQVAGKIQAYKAFVQEQAQELNHVYIVKEYEYDRLVQTHGVAIRRSLAWDRVQEIRQERSLSHEQELVVETETLLWGDGE